MTGRTHVEVLARTLNVERRRITKRAPLTERDAGSTRTTHFFGGQLFVHRLQDAADDRASEIELPASPNASPLCTRDRTPGRARAAQPASNPRRSTSRPDHAWPWPRRTISDWRTGSRNIPPALRRRCGKRSRTAHRAHDAIMPPPAAHRSIIPPVSRGSRFPPPESQRALELGERALGVAGGEALATVLDGVRGVASSTHGLPTKFPGARGGRGRLGDAGAGAVREGESGGARARAVLADDGDMTARRWMRGGAKRGESNAGDVFGSGRVVARGRAFVEVSTV